MEVWRRGAGGAGREARGLKQAAPGAGGPWPRSAEA